MHSRSYLGTTASTLLAGRVMTTRLLSGLWGNVAGVLPVDDNPSPWPPTPERRWFSGGDFTFGAGVWLWARLG